MLIVPGRTPGTYDEVRVMTSFNPRQLMHHQHPLDHSLHSMSYLQVSDGLLVKRLHSSRYWSLVASSFDFHHRPSFGLDQKKSLLLYPTVLRARLRCIIWRFPALVAVPLAPRAWNQIRCHDIASRISGNIFNGLWRHLGQPTFGLKQWTPSHFAMMANLAILKHILSRFVIVSWVSLGLWCHTTQRRRGC